MHCGCQSISVFNNSNIVVVFGRIAKSAKALVGWPNTNAWKSKDWRIYAPFHLSMLFIVSE